MAIWFHNKKKKPETSDKAKTNDAALSEHASELSPPIDLSLEDSTVDILAKIKSDTFTIGVIAGILGTAVLHILSVIEKSLGLILMSSMQTSGELFLAPAQVNTPAGLIVSAIAHLMIGSAGAVLLAYFIKITGKPFYWLKGLGLAGLMSLGGMGLVVKIMDVAPQMRSDSTTTMFHIFNFLAYGLTVSYIIYKLMDLHAKQQSR
ncbi:MAG TPA: hypothetical protein PKA10_12405 [Selenomonadales bacterium]|nr:hypothetical protein [Selenomonadales bacterium]